MKPLPQNVALRKKRRVEHTASELGSRGDRALLEACEREIAVLKAREKKLMNLLKRLVCRMDPQNRNLREEILALEEAIEIPPEKEPFS
ncbi:MAG: hypothetical protein GWO19_08085 [Nitrospinaceae bacterium]|nr:hypothetical protein [Nitrospinaceae bacterium]